MISDSEDALEVKEVVVRMVIALLAIMRGSEWKWWRQEGSTKFIDEAMWY
ncbi:hypothetical protein SLEP1_g9404 [Rubroshorea leprosula]|uniref:Uncharacterized protein n=1 Tax=Rubroshorea leprosula TaxID=152421 RepID=A0AAV5IEP8_9ROSI|nr:hypothetical protein SLEP1_g9404 [Rubroshorea leprosula]